jgi:hypothetical protein
MSDDIFETAERFQSYDFGDNPWAHTHITYGRTVTMFDGSPNFCVGEYFVKAFTHPPLYNGVYRDSSLVALLEIGPSRVRAEITAPTRQVVYEESSEGDDARALWLKTFAAIDAIDAKVNGQGKEAKE